MPEAAMSGRHVAVHVSGDPSANKVKRMGDALSALPATGGTRAEGASAGWVIDDSARARHTEASMPGKEHDIPDPRLCGIGALP
jgi:hypothetical protein